MGATCWHAAAHIWDFQFYNYTHQVFQQHLNGSKIVVRCHRCATEENAQVFKARMRWGRWRCPEGTTRGALQPPMSPGWDGQLKPPP